MLGEIDIITLVLLIPLLPSLAHHVSDVLDILFSRGERGMRSHHYGLAVSHLFDFWVFQTYLGISSVQSTVGHGR